MVSKLAARVLGVQLLLGCGIVHAAGYLETRIAIEDFAVGKDYESAFELGEELLTQAEQEFGAASNQLVDAHLLLASLYRQQANFPDAELHLLMATGILETRDGAQSTTLIQPLIALGETYFAASDYPLSLAAFEEARAIGRRDQGLLNFDQIEIIDRMSVVALAMNDFDQARALQREAVAIVQRSHGEQSLEYVDAQFDLAAWLMRQGEGEDARRAFMEIERVVREELADDPLLAIRVLRTKSVVMRNGGEQTRNYRTRPLELEQALELAATLAEPSFLLQAEILRDIGDWYVALSVPAHVAEPYRRAWVMLDELEDGFRYQQEWFGPLALISAPQFELRVMSREPDAPWGRVEISFTLNVFGQAGNVRITHSDPPGLLDSAATRQILDSRFRPRMDDRGEPIASEATVGYDFRYDAALVEDLSARGRAAPAAAVATPPTPDAAAE